MKILRRACAEAVPRRKYRRERRAVYWWTDQIAELRRKCLRLRRQAQRAIRRDPNSVPLYTEYKAAKKELKRAIKQSKWRCWRELGMDIDRDPWGLGYKLVMRKLGAFVKGNPSNVVEGIVNALFPTHPRRVISLDTRGNLDPPVFTEEELSVAASSMRNRRAPGPDGLPTELLKAVAKYRPGLLLNMYNSCLKAGTFPTCWKTARLVLISKGKGPADAPSSYRPLCMLDTAGKLLEKLLRPRLHEAVRAAGGLAARQYGFRPGFSTIDAIQEVVNAARSTEQGNHYSRPVCLLVTLDVKNAFNSVRWDKALEALERDFRVPEYLLQILGDYLNERFLVYDTDDGSRRKEITSGAAQGSILGPDVWNVFYDGLLRMEIPEGATLVGYADDVAAIIIARNVDEVQLLLNQVMRRVITWMEDHGLQLAMQKTDIVLLTKKRIDTLCHFVVGDASVQSKAAIKYLGVMLDNKLSFGEHLRRAADKAATVVASLSRIMANTNGPRPDRRKLLMRTAETIMLYGAEVWADALQIEMYRKRLAAVQRRGALRITCSYRTVSEPAVLVIAGTVPIDLLAQERSFVHRNTSILGRKLAKETARTRSIVIWQSRWERETRGRWTARLLPTIHPWLSRKTGEVDFYLTQFLTGHGLFSSYLCKMGKVENANCAYGDSVLDDVHHTFFECTRWAGDRSRLETDLGSVTPDNIIGVMLRGQEEWQKVATFVKDILRKKKAETDVH